MTNDLIDNIKKWEGVRHEPYLDSAGIPTIGVGFTTYSDGRKVTMKDKPLDDATIDKMLREKLEKFESMVRKMLGDTALPEKSFDALVSLCYNIGQGNLSTSTVLKRVKANKSDLSGIQEGFLMWNKATVNGKKQEVKGLTNRRNGEFELYQRGIQEAAKPQTAKEKDLERIKGNLGNAFGVKMK